MTKLASIRSGAQSGVDRAALDTAKAYGIRICVWCPKGGWAEDYPDPPGVLAIYPELQETPSKEPEQRTVWNVRDSNATLIICSRGADSGGTDLTDQTARELGKPCFIIRSEEDVDKAFEWLKSLGDELDLNVAGPRASEWPEAYETACRYLTRVIRGE